MPDALETLDIDVDTMTAGHDAEGLSHPEILTSKTTPGVRKLRMKGFDLLAYEESHEPVVVL